MTLPTHDHWTSSGNCCGSERHTVNQLSKQRVTTLPDGCVAVNSVSFRRNSVDSHCPPRCSDCSEGSPEHLALAASTGNDLCAPAAEPTSLHDQLPSLRLRSTPVNLRTCQPVLPGECNEITFSVDLLLRITESVIELHTWRSSGSGFQVAEFGFFSRLPGSAGWVVKLPGRFPAPCTGHCCRNPHL